MNKKAFLFTISVIIFASTLLIMTQLFANYNSNYERTVLSSYKTSLQPYLSDDIAYDISRMLDLGLDINYSSTDINITIDGSIPKDFNFTQKLSDYNNFLNSKYFPTVLGAQSINFNTSDSTLELLFGSDYEYKYNYDSNIVEFISTIDTLNSIDLNLDLESTSLNRVQEPSPAGSASINISYTDDQNSFSASYTFDPTSNNEVVFVYSTDKNISVQFGNTSSNNSFKIDSNVPSELNYSIKFNYAFDSFSLPVRYGVVLSHNGNNVDSNSELKIRN